MIGLTVVPLVPGTSTSLLVHKKTPWVPLFSKKEVNEKPRGKMDSRNDQFVYAQMKGFYFLSFLFLTKSLESWSSVITYFLV